MPKIHDEQKFQRSESMIFFYPFPQALLSTDPPFMENFEIFKLIRLVKLLH